MMNLQVRDVTLVIGESGGARSVRYFEGGLATTSGRMMMIMGAALCSDCEVAVAGACTIA